MRYTFPRRFEQLEGDRRLFLITADKRSATVGESNRQMKVTDGKRPFKRLPVPPDFGPRAWRDRGLDPRA